MTTVSDAEKIILSQARDYGTGHLPFEQALGRVLAEDLRADRDLPPCDRVTMDGIAIRFSAFESGTRAFNVLGVQAAGQKPEEIDEPNECVEIMTGAALPPGVDTVVRYEDVEIKNKMATVLAATIRKGQNIHPRGKDKKQNDVVASAGQVIDAALISMAASVGKSMLLVKKLPSLVIISTGSELVDVTELPSSYQVRRSNNYTIRAVLKPYGIIMDMLHIADDLSVIKEQIDACLYQYDVVLLTGGISMGKFDYVPQVLEELNVTTLFHKVQQRPGKPFWFGNHAAGALVFAFPGNPVSAFLCLHRYFLPWLHQSLGLKKSEQPCAALDSDLAFAPALTYFVQVKIKISAQGQILATPLEGNGSGDFANLVDSDAFMELPLEQTNFKKGEVFRIWPFKKIL